jgi:hypothetical protein
VPKGAIRKREIGFCLPFSVTSDKDNNNQSNQQIIERGILGDRDNTRQSSVDFGVVS